MIAVSNEARLQCLSFAIAVETIRNRRCNSMLKYRGEISLAQTRLEAADISKESKGDHDENVIMIFAAEALLKPECRCGFSGGWWLKWTPQQSAYSVLELGTRLETGADHRFTYEAAELMDQE